MLTLQLAILVILFYAILIDKALNRGRTKKFNHYWDMYEKYLRLQRRRHNETHFERRTS